MKRRVSSILLCLCMVLSLLPVSALAATADTAEASVTASDNTITYYDTLDDAITAAQSMSGSTLTLLKGVDRILDVSVDSGTFTIDLNGQTLSFTDSDVTISRTANVVFKDSKGGGKITGTGPYSTVYVYSGALLKIEGGTYESASAASISNEGTIGDLLADGYAYKNISDSSWVTDMSGYEISNVTVQEAPIEMFCASVTEAGGTVHNYMTIEKAITAAQGQDMSGCTVTLLKDVSTTAQLTVTSGTFAIDLNGQTWSGTDCSKVIYLSGSSRVTFKDSGSSGKIIGTGTGTVYTDGVPVVFEGGTYEGGTQASICTSGKVGDLLADGYAYRNISDSSWVTDMSGCEISNVTVQAIPVTITAQPEDASVLSSYTDAEAPTFRVTADNTAAPSGKTITYQWYKDSTSIDGATSSSYTIPTGISAGTYHYYCAVTCDGYTVNTKSVILSIYDEGSGNFSVTTASNNTIYFPTLEEAIAAAKGMSGSTVKLLADATTANEVDVNSGTFTIDLNGHTWTSNTSAFALHLTRGTLPLHVTLKDSGSGGKITSSTAVEIIRSEAASVTIESGIYDNDNESGSGNAVLSASLSSTITIQGGTFAGTYLNYLVSLASVNASISGGTFNGASVLFNQCGSVALTGGTYKNISTLGGASVGTLLANGYGYQKSGAWVNNPTDTSLDNVTVQLAPAHITAQPQGGGSATYGYTSADAPALSVTAETTAAASEGSAISYQWYRVKNGSETSDTAVGTNSSTLTIPTGLDADTYSFYCAVSCDGYTVNSQSAAFTVNPKDLSGANVTLTIPEGGYTYDNTAKMPAITVTLGGKTLALGADYITYYLDNTDAGTASVTITGQGNYTGSTGTTFAIAKAQKEIHTISSILSYDGSAHNILDRVEDSEGCNLCYEPGYTVQYATGTGMTVDNEGTANFDAVTWSDFSDVMPTVTDAGNYPVRVKISSKNYEDAYKNGFKTIKKAAAPTLTFPTAGGITYGQKLSASTLTGGSTEYGTFAWTNGDTVPTVTNSGYEVTFTPSAATVKNYEAITGTTATVAIAVSKAAPAVTVNAVVSGDEGNRNAALTATVTGVDGGEVPTGTVKFVDTTSGSDADIAGAAAVAVTDGKAAYTWTGRADQIYKVKAVYSGDDNYNTASGELNFDTSKQNQAALVIGSIGTKTYGDSAFPISATGGGGTGTLSYTSSDPTIVSISGTTATIHKAGTVTITAIRAADDTYNEASATVSLTIGKKALTVKANDQLNIIKGAALPELTYTVTGLVGSDTFTSPTVSATAANTGTVGEYNITISGGTLSNADSYTVTYTNGRLTVVNAVYTVTVTNGTGGGSYSEGQTVTITAATRSGYTFTGWSSSDGVTFASSTAGTTTFAMPGKAVTITANYSQNSNGGDGGNGGSSSGGGVATGTTVPVSSEAGKTSVSTSVSGSTVSISATDSQIAAIASSAKETGTVTVDVSSLKVNAATIPSKVVSAVQKAEGSEGLAVALPTGTVTLDQPALAAVEDKGDVKFAVETVDNSKLTDTQKATLGSQASSATVVDVNVYAGSSKVSTFGNGAITVSVPYTLKSGESADNITVWFVNEDGTIEPKTASYANGKVTFTTEHLSQYLIVDFPFTDVTESAWYYDSVAYAYNNGLFAGTSDTTFSPNTAMTRQMIWMVLARIDGEMPSDMDEARAWAMENGISDGTNPTNSITREQMAEILYRYAQYKGYDITQGGMAVREFADYESISEYALTAMAWTVNAGLMQGSSNNLMPAGSATRAQVATILQRFCQNVTK